MNQDEGRCTLWATFAEVNARSIDETHELRRLSRVLRNQDAARDVGSEKTPARCRDGESNNQKSEQLSHEFGFPFELSMRTYRSRVQQCEHGIKRRSFCSPYRAKSYIQNLRRSRPAYAACHDAMAFRRHTAIPQGIDENSSALRRQYKHRIDDASSERIKHRSWQRGARDDIVQVPDATFETGFCEFSVQIARISSCRNMQK